MQKNSYNYKELIECGEGKLFGEDNWIQLLEFHYTGLSFHAQAMADWMMSLIHRTRASGLNPKIICMDNNPENHAV